MLDMSPSPRGTHLQIAQSLRDAVAQNTYTSQLPPVRALMASYGVSRGTVIRALTALREAGLVEPVQGSGWYIKGTIDTRAADVRTREVITKLKSGDHIPSEENLALLLNLSRLTIRSALAQLEGEGLISAATTRGRTVL